MGNNQPQKCSLCNTVSKLDLCTFCKKGVCLECYDYPVLNNYQEHALRKKLDYVAACKECFLSKTELDFTKKYDIVGDQNKRQILLIHGAGSCRKMFLPHARDLAKSGYRCILMDLPRHGSRMDQPLNLQNCLQAIKETISQACRYKEDLTIAGGSLGGYVLMLVLGIEPTLCKRAVVMMSGQNVGVNRGNMASIGLFFMNKSVEWLSQVAMVKTFMNSATGNKHLNQNYLDEFIKSGSYFKHAKENIRLLKHSDYAQSLKKTGNQVKILFINGQKDFRDSEHIWLNAAGDKSKLIVYQKVDHFFSHDNRTYQRLVDDIKTFAEA